MFTTPLQSQLGIYEVYTLDNSKQYQNLKPDTNR